MKAAPCICGAPAVRRRDGNGFWFLRCLRARCGLKGFPARSLASAVMAWDQALATARRGLRLGRQGELFP